LGQLPEPTLESPQYVDHSHGIAYDDLKKRVEHNSLSKPQPLAVLSFVLISAVAAQFFFPSSVSGDDFASRLVHAAEHNGDMRQAAFEAQLAELEKARSLIEAESDEQLLTAEITYLTKHESIRQKQVASFGNILDAAETLTTASIELRIAELQRSIAEEAKERSERLFQEGRISGYEADTARIDYQEAEIDLLQARRTLEEAERLVTFTAGSEWNAALFDNTSLPSLLSLLSRKPTEKDWIDHDYTIARREKELQRALLRRDLLPANASKVERQKADMAVEQARLAVEAALFESRSEHRDLVFLLESARRRIEVAERKLELENRKLEETRIKFDRGDLPAGEVERSRINALTARKTRVEAVARYVSLLVTAAVSTAAGLTGEDDAFGWEAVFH
jgi:hypothetical protein